MGQIPAVLIFMVFLAVPYGPKDVRIVETYVSESFPDFGSCIDARDAIINDPVPPGLSRTVTACKYVAASRLQSVIVRPCPHDTKP